MIDSSIPRIYNIFSYVPSIGRDIIIGETVDGLCVRLAEFIPVSVAPDGVGFGFVAEGGGQVVVIRRDLEMETQS